MINPGFSARCDYLGAVGEVRYALADFGAMVKKDECIIIDIRWWLLLQPAGCVGISVSEFERGEHDRATAPSNGENGGFVKDRIRTG
jgi:hypothetical protein